MLERYDAASGVFHGQATLKLMLCQQPVHILSLGQFFLCALQVGIKQLSAVTKVGRGVSLSILT
jgi:hypothetical protein